MKQLLLSLSLVLTACAGANGPLDADSGSDGETEGGDGTVPMDAGLPTSCADYPALELGRCVQAGTDLDCTGAGGETTAFVALSEGDAMRLVLGPQGSQMLVFLAKGAGFEPGDPDQVGSTENPRVEMWLHDLDSDQEIGRYRGYVAFVEEDAGAALVSAGALFVIIEQSPSELAGHELEVEGILQDREGALRCGFVRIKIES